MPMERVLALPAVNDSRILHQRAPFGLSSRYSPPPSKSLTGFSLGLALRIAVSVSGMTVTLLAVVRLTVNVTAGYRRMSMDTMAQP